MRSSPAVIVLMIAIMSAIGISFPFLPVEKLETRAFALNPTSELGVYEQHIEFELFCSTVDVEGVDVDISGHLNLEKFVWIELNWETDTGEHTVTLDSFPAGASYECKKDDVEFHFGLSLHGMSVRVKIPFEHRGLPTLTFAYYSPFG